MSSPPRLAGLLDVRGGRGGGELTATFVVAPDHPVLPGHFPGAPLVPGVLLLDAVVEAWERLTGAAHRLVAVEDVRWLQPLAPGIAASLAGRVTVAAAEVAIAGEWREAAGRLCTFALCLAPRSLGPDTGPAGAAWPSGRAQS